MKRSSLPHIMQQHLVLVGGGHSHAIVLRELGKKPIPNVQITLITNIQHTPYSGMLPGYVEGLYSFENCHINLRSLAHFSQAKMVLDQAIGLDLKNNAVLLENHPPISFDLLSIDIGSTPTTLSILDANNRIIPVKPISQFLQYWDQLIAEVTQAPERPMRVAIVGGGAGGVELALAMQAHLHRIYQAAQQPVTNLTMHLFHRGNRLLPERHLRVSKTLMQILIQRGVHIHLQEAVCAIEDTLSPDHSSSRSQFIHCESGLTVPCDRIFWVTQAAATPWLKESGLKTDDRGFVLVNDTLQSISHPQVFAAGDVATMLNHPRPKAGVFAVRQGKPLLQNLRRALQHQPLLPFIPQKEFLILIGTGDRSALASRGSFCLGAHPLIWKWKDYIDRQFMAGFNLH